METVTREIGNLGMTGLVGSIMYFSAGSRGTGILTALKDPHLRVAFKMPLLALCNTQTHQRPSGLPLGYQG